MPIYFHGWRRKIGVLTLVMACAFAAGWVRSHVNSDALAVAVGKYKSHWKQSHWKGAKLHVTHGIFLYVMKSEANTLILSRICVQSPEEADIKDVEAKCKYPQWESADNDVANPVFAEAQWQSCGFGVCTIPSDGEAFTRHLFFPYWSIVTPLTLLSAYLLLSKPRVPKHPESP